MRQILSAGAAALAILCASCSAGYEPAQLPATHPASPDAPASPVWRLPPTLSKVETSSVKPLVLDVPGQAPPKMPAQASQTDHTGHDGHAGQTPSGGQ
ncbi:hypothetical protein [Desulfocurvibacter africanus]|uniref:Lipoprotein n=1 Tax=Desulfocurvibacter africanus subsp. africanus str. Walvis Bay TaxID=690850 RepID=F3YVT9_DESAF|nr:hypothetical protein [Desulfocurvibacter africanus]EGJ48897.1 hypothetical protein Desaf_0544 [Desulfocurvibacter africanus subsp. africanus str. Walvis Bay]